jgi:DHA1 family bicyclomycin/chloramphenicol resistance-like MFS transporter
MSQVMMLFALAPVLAPVLGGWLHDQFGWRTAGRRNERFPSVFWS